MGLRPATRLARAISRELLAGALLTGLLAVVQAATAPNGNPHARASGGHEPGHLGSRHTERRPSGSEAPAGYYRGAHHDDRDQQDSQEVGQ